MTPFAKKVLFEGEKVQLTTVQKISNDKPKIRERSTQASDNALFETLRRLRSEIAKDLARLQQELALVEAEMDELISESGEGAGDDQADSGTKTFEREHEMSLVINARDMVLQTERALERIDAKTYGYCEDCGAAIGKARLQVFPRATLCMICKQKEERR